MLLRRRPIVIATEAQNILQYYSYNNIRTHVHLMEDMGIKLQKHLPCRIKLIFKVGEIRGEKQINTLRYYTLIVLWKH